MPCRVCAEPVAVEQGTCAHCGSGLFDGLRSSSAISLPLPVLGDLMRFGRWSRSAIAFGLALAVAGLLLTLVSLLG